jgi:hypothetical protein
MSSFSGCSRGKEVNLLPPVSPAGSSHVSCTRWVLDGMGSSSEGRTALAGNPFASGRDVWLAGRRSERVD